MMGKVFFIRMGKMIETSENTGVQLNKDINFALNLSEVGQEFGGGVCLRGDRQIAVCLFPGSQYTGNGTPTDIYTHVSHPPNPQYTVDRPK